MRTRILIAIVFSILSSLSLAQSNADSKVVLGKLGQSVKSAVIYASASSRSRIYYRLKPYEYLVLNESKSNTYTRVLLKNGWFGYVRRDAVAVLPYEVTKATPVIPQAVSTPNRDPGSNTSRGAAAMEGLRYIGTQYKWGGNDPWNGIDCSGFVKFLTGKIGMSLPRTASEQAKVGQPIYKLEDLIAGDRLYFWDSKRGKIGHTGMYLGNGYFVHSSSGKGGVSTDYLGADKWRRILVSARR
jgi:cell wall-associated NlpC family hydrolase